jgi:hypothetical protein
MDFHDDHTAFDTTSTATDDVSHMYVPHADDHSLGDDDGTNGSDDSGAETTGSHGDGETVTIEVGDDEVTADATIDIDHDGTNDTAVVQDAAGERIAITDLDGDGDADHAALLDESGHVLDTAHVTDSGEWVQDSPTDKNPYGAVGTQLGGGADGNTPDSGSGSGSGTPGATPGETPGQGGNTIVVDSGGSSMEAQATVDSDHDGDKDTAIVSTPDGNQVAFTDSDGDGHADKAVVYGTDGKLIGTAHYDEATGTWIEGAGGTGEAGTTTAGSGDTGGLGAGAGADTGGDNTGGIGTSPAGDTGTGNSEQIEVTVGGRTAEVNADYDLNNDGQDETAIVAGPDGTRIAFSDTDGDGDADKAAVYDAAGNLVGTATYNEGSGTWVQD